MHDLVCEENVSTALGLRLAILRMQGYYLQKAVLAPGVCREIEQDFGRRMQSSRGIEEPGRPIRVPTILQQSDAALALLNRAELASLVADVLTPDAILSVFELVQEGGSEWRRDFGRIRQAVSTRHFRPGVSMLIPLEDSEVQVLAASQHLEEGVDPESASCGLLTLNAPRGSAVVLESGVCYRTGAARPHLRLAFVRPWVKPNIFYSLALSKDRLELLNDAARRWCGSETGLPTSVDDFLAIEAAAVASTAGRGKGSGI